VRRNLSQTQRVTSDSVLADGQIYTLAADGTRVVFISWTAIGAPPTGVVPEHWPTRRLGRLKP